ncbi:TRAM domain-containing protein [Halobaculum gomorrense]|uniref:Predicted RNA-binding protein, contains TRAM domain n=1 Tax=Halobaculum gomorrense TaxID=43928 RepID=A0A1M5NPM0_9EURY|nr:TRAM domain-containing protein [Halobaculum gomorrense]SHG91427.1 Predicted RNA-binding protein, contains TRAM domain [Halobaculum gomorrense]
MEISEDLRCVFSAEVEERDGSYVIEVPERELQLDSIHADEVYRVALLARHAGGSEGADTAANRDGSADDRDARGERVATAESDGQDDTDGTGSGDGSSHERRSRDEGIDSATETASGGEPEPPVDRGDEVTVDIEGIGDQGDGIARVDRGYVIIVPDTEKGERVTIRVTSVKQNVAFAEVVERVERHHYE